MPKYDAHVAAEGATNATLKNALEELGFSDDGLLSRHVTWRDGTPMSSCPLIGIHMSKKYEQKDGIGSDLQKARKLFESHGQTGYGHSEIQLEDVTLKSEGIMRHSHPSFWPLQPQPSAENKKWDVHIAIPKSNMHDQLDELLQFYGFDWIDLKKKHRDNQLFRIYSAQGISHPKIGHKLYSATLSWLQDMNVPQADCKLEVYIEMFRVGNTKIVPPVVNQIEYAT